MLSKVPQLSYIHSIAVSEVIIRSTKHIFTAFLQGLELTHLSIGVAHFLNCFLSSSSSVTVTLSDELKSLTGSSSSRNKKRRNGTRTKQPSGKEPWAKKFFLLFPRTKKIREIAPKIFQNKCLNFTKFFGPCFENSY